LDFAIANVLQNALEATGKGGRVSLTAEGMSVGDKGSSVLQICVLDSGCGIAPEHLSKVAAPYFTTKKNHDGLGLSMASRFIEMHGGLLTIESPASQGVSVAIVLPAGPAGDQPGE
jgi:signal transduction histidine kinase